jgi:hypothetical protein
MKYPAIVAAGLLAAVTLAGPASAFNLQAKMESCLTKHANTRQAATITLECSADAGKLSACKVVQSQVPSPGFEKAAICVAEVLPMAGKTGTIRVPVRFPGE